jgi:iron complex outermembrane receptor protein
MGAIALSALASAGAARAQDSGAAGGDAAEANSSGATEIIVTAQRRAERLQEVPISIAALTGDQLAVRGADALEEMGEQVPGLYFKSINISMPNVAIRGIGTTQIDNSAEAPVGLFVDDVYVARFTAGLSGFYDVERVEVLRGPQGTLYGRNTIGGAINVISRDPTRDFEGYVEAQYGSYDAIRTRAAISGPLSDTLSARIAVATNNRKGWTRNAVDGRRGNDEQNYGFRGKLRFEPSERAVFTLTGDYWKDDQNEALAELKGVFNLGAASPQPEATPNDPFIGHSDLKGYQRRELWSVTLKGDIELSDTVGLTSITGYRDHKSSILRDLDATAAPNLTTSDAETGDQFSQEIRLASLGSGPFEWLVGGYYFKSTSDRQEAWTLDGLLPQFAAFEGVYGWPFAGSTESFAAFAQVNFEIVPQFEIVAGLRYSHDKKKGAFRTYTTATSALPSFLQPTAGFQADVNQSWESIDPAITVNFKPSRDFLLYASFKTGFKSGGFQNRPSTLALARTAYNPEDLKAFEGGIKSTWLDGRLVANLSVFDYDYRDLQQTVLAPNSALTITDNVGRASIRGAELELTMSPSDRWQFNLGYSYLDATYKDYVDAANIQRAGNRLARAPKHTINASADYTAPLAGGELALRLSYYQRSKTFFVPDNLPVNTEGAYGLLGGRIAFTDASERLTVAVSGENLTNKAYCANQATSVPTSSAARCWLGAPRQVTGSISYRF